MGKYIIDKTPKGKYHFNLLATNGEIILSSQMYMSRKGALKGIRSITKNAKVAEVEDRTAKDYKEFSNPKFVLSKGKDGKIYFKLIANNGKAIGTSQGYAKMATAKAGVKSVKTNSESAIEKTTNKADAPKKIVKKK